MIFYMIGNKTDCAHCLLLLNYFTIPSLLPPGKVVTTALI